MRQSIQYWLDEEDMVDEGQKYGKQLHIDVRTLAVSDNKLGR